MTSDRIPFPQSASNSPMFAGLSDDTVLSRTVATLWHR